MCDWLFNVTVSRILVLKTAKIGKSQLTKWVRSHEKEDKGGTSQSCARQLAPLRTNSENKRGKL